jgi:PAS domain S-box-containing protein
MELRYNDMNPSDGKGNPVKKLYSYDLFKLLNIITTASVQEITISSFFKKIFHGIIEFLDFDAGGIYLIDQNRNSAILQYDFGVDTLSVKNVQVIPLNVPPYSVVFKEKRILYAERYQELFPERKVSGICALASIPLICETGVIGVLNVASRRRHSFSDEEKQLFELMGKEIGNEIYRYLIQDELRRSEKKYRQLIETAQEGIWVLDVNGLTTFVNPRMAAMLGYPEVEMIGKPVFSFMNANQIPVAQQYLKRRLRGISEQHEFTLRTKEGMPLFAIVGTSPIYDEQNHIIGILGCITDISERKRVELELRENEEKFRNVIEQSRDGIILTDELGKVIEWNRGLEITTGLSRESVLGRDIWDAIYAISNKLQNPKLFCDGFRLEQVFINILSNAIKYSPNGKEISITSEQSPLFYTIIFQDQGYGFTPDELQSIWRPFSKINRSSKEDLFSGTGVGLYISKGIVEMHGGTIEITSSGPNMGSCVKVRLPVEKGESEN